MKLRNAVRVDMRVMGLMLVAVSLAGSAKAANIDPADKHAWASQVGWVNHAPTDGGGVTVVSAGANGYLSGYAWSSQAGWINFDSTHSQVTVNIINGQFSGEAWGENVGWVGFRDTSPAYGVRTTAFDAPPILGATVIRFQ